MYHELLKLARGSTFIFASRVIGAVLAFLTHVLLARWMGAAELGIYVLAFSWCTLLSIITGLGYPTASLRIIGQGLARNDPQHIRGFIRHCWLVVTGSGLVIAALGIALILVTRERIPAGYVMPFSIALLCVPVFTLLRMNLRIAHALSWFKLAFLPNTALRPLLFIILVFAVWSADVQLTSSMAMSLHLAAICLIAIGQFAILKPMLNQELKEAEPSYDSGSWLRIAAPLLLITLFTQFFPEISVVLAGSMLSADEIAVFNASFRTALLIAFGLNAVNAIMTPRLSRLYAAGDREQLQRLISVSVHLKFWPALLAVIVLALFGEQILALFGDDFKSGYETLVLLSLSQLVLAAVGPVDVLLSVTGHQNRCLRVFALALVATVILNLLLVPQFGMVGAAATVLLVVIFWAIWLHMLVVRHLNVYPSLFAFAHTFRKIPR